MVVKKSAYVIYEWSQREADESVLSAETSSSSGLGKEEKPSKYRLIDATKYYIVEEDVSDDEDIDPKHYQTPTYQRSVNRKFHIPYFLDIYFSWSSNADSIRKKHQVNASNYQICGTIRVRVLLE